MSELTVAIVAPAVPPPPPHTDAEGTAWDRPAPLTRGRRFPPFPSTALPRWLGEYVDAVAVATQTPTDLVGMLTLASLAAVSGGLARVEVRPGWREPVNIFVAVALPPGSRKSAVFTEVTAPLTAFDAEEVDRMRATIIEADISRKIAEGAATQAQTAAAKATGEEAGALADEAVKLAERAANILVPPMPRLLADDATPEALTSLLAEHGRIAVMAPEGDLFDMMAGRYQSGGGPNLGVYLKGHAGDPLRVDRKGRGPEFAPTPALTVGLAVQPEVLAMLADRPGFRGRGLLARFLYSLPVNTVGRRLIAAPPVPAATRFTYANEIRSLARSLIDQAELARMSGSQESLVLTLSTEAAQTIEAFEAELEPRLAPEIGDLGHIADWSAKLAGAVVRIAGLLHLADTLHTGWAAPISGTTMVNATLIGRYLAEHALAVFDLMGADPAIEKAGIVLRWIERAEVESFTRRDCFYAVRGSRFPKVEDLDPALEVLVGHGWIRPRPAPPGPKPPGRPPSPVFEVNPYRSEPTQPTQP